MRRKGIGVGDRGSEMPVLVVIDPDHDPDTYEDREMVQNHRQEVGMSQLCSRMAQVSGDLLKAGPCVVDAVKTPRPTVQSVQLGLVEAKRQGDKPTQCHFKKAGVQATRVRARGRSRKAAIGEAGIR